MGGAPIVVDDEIHEFNPKVFKKEDVVFDENCVFLISCQRDQSVHFDFADWLFDKGFFEQTYILHGDDLRAQDALLKCCEDSSIKTVLDVGCGIGHHARIFMEYGKDVTGIEGGMDVEY